MIIFLAFIVFLLMIGSLISLIVGLIVPSAFTGIFKRNLGRKKTGLVFIGITLAFFVVLSILAVNSPTASTQQKNNVTTVSNQQVPIKKPITQSIPKVSPKPTSTLSTPTPTRSDWVANPQCSIGDTGVFDTCLRDKYPLQATVKADSFAMNITNTQNVEWTECNITFDDNSYATNPDNFFTIEADSTTRVPWGSLIDGNGNRFDDTKAQPGVIDISCTVNHEQRESQYGGFQ